MEQRGGYEPPVCAARTLQRLGGNAVASCGFVDSFDKRCGLRVSPAQDGQVVRTSQEGAVYTVCRQDADSITMLESGASGDPADRRREFLLARD